MYRFIRHTGLTDRQFGYLVAGTVCLGVGWSQKKYVRSAITGYKFTKVKYNKKYNPLEESAYNGDCETYSQYVSDIHKFNADRERSFILKRLYPNIVLHNLFKVNHIRDNIQTRNMACVIRAQASELLEIFFDKIFKQESQQEAVAESTNDMLKYAVAIKYEPFLWTYIAYKLDANNDLVCTVDKKVDIKSKSKKNKQIKS